MRLKIQKGNSSSDSEEWKLRLSLFTWAFVFALPFALAFPAFLLSGAWDLAGLMMSAFFSALGFVFVYAVSHVYEVSFDRLRGRVLVVKKTLFGAKRQEFPLDALRALGFQANPRVKGAQTQSLVLLFEGYPEYRMVGTNLLKGQLRKMEAELDELRAWLGLSGPLG